MLMLLFLLKAVGSGRGRFENEGGYFAFSLFSAESEPSFVSVTLPRHGHRQVSWLRGRLNIGRTVSTFPGNKTEWHSKTATLNHSGGTAPVFHRTSLLSPCGHPRQNQYAGMNLCFASVCARLQTEAMQNPATIQTTIPAAISISSRWPAFVVLFLGITVLYAVAFSPFPQAHNATHDTRHANGFPCH
jgi:cobalt transporter subunit CbtB